MLKMFFDKDEQYNYLNKKNYHFFFFMYNFEVLFCTFYKYHKLKEFWIDYALD